jgi:DNA-binding transcriptional LysR family regulator
MGAERERRMTNIPIELLRTFVALVDQRGFTKAAQALGCTQPAVSSQIKRLQTLLGTELLDKSAPGVILTDKGQAIVDRARQLLTINDQILDLAAPRALERPLRIGIPGDFGGALLPTALAEFRRNFPHQAFHVRCEGSDELLRGLQHDELDLAVAFTRIGSPIEAHDRWTERVVWVHGPSTDYDAADPVPLVAHDESCLLNRLSTQTLDRAHREWELAFRATSSISIAAAVAAGLGIAASIERAVPAELAVWRDPPLPPLPDIECGIYLRPGGDRGLLEQLADAIADVIRPHEAAPAAAAERIAG